MKKPPHGRPFRNLMSLGSALTGFEPALGLVDDVNPALTTHDPAIPVARLQGAKRIPDLHVQSPVVQRACAFG